MLPEEEILFKEYIKCLDEIFEDSKLGKKSRDKVINRQYIKASGNLRLIQLHNWFQNKAYNTEN